jgi:hypothetical protein
MKFDSPFFDGIRVKPDKDRRARKVSPTCDWPGCKEPGGHRAPKGRDKEREYWSFCLAHARDYNHSYNYFAGMNALDVAQYQKDAVVGHRPTWKMGQGGTGARPERSGSARFYRGAEDPFGLFRNFAGKSRAKAAAEKPESRAVRNAERKALEAMGLDAGVSAAEIKARFKDLVKRHHPDANRGDRSTEDRLVEIIQAYKYLKSIGFR